MFDLQIKNVVKIIKDRGYAAVGIQLPEGLKDQATDIADELKVETGCEIFIFGDPCYGACDLADHEAKNLNCDALFHFGHSRVLKKTQIPVHYVEVKILRDPIPLLCKHLDKLPKKLGIVTTVQHIHLLSEISSYLRANGITVKLGKASGRVAYSGQVLGCSFCSARDIDGEVEGFLYIGTGNFHPLGVALSTGKQTFALDLEKGELRDMATIKEPILRKRFAQIAKAKEAEVFGIIVGEKAGQRRAGLASSVKKLLETHSKKGYIISLREITPETLYPFRHLDAFVNTACPRVTIDDAGRYKKPLLTPVELEIVLGVREWEDYSMDEI